MKQEDWTALLDRAMARRRALVLGLEDLNRRMQVRTRAIFDVDEEIAELRQRLTYNMQREAA